MRQRAGFAQLRSEAAASLQPLDEEHTRCQDGNAANVFTGLSDKDDSTVAIIGISLKDIRSGNLELRGVFSLDFDCIRLHLASCERAA